MPIDVSILRQQAPMQMPSLLESRARANQLMASDAQLAANALQLQKLQREEQQAQDINKLYSLPGAVSPTGEIDYGVIGQAAPGMGLARLMPDLNKQRLAELKLRGEAGEATYKQAKARDEAINQRLNMYREKYRFVTTPEAAFAMHDQVHADPILQPFFNAMGVDAAQGRARIQEAIANGTFSQFLQEQSSALDQVRDQRYVQALNRDVDEAVKPPTTKSEIGEREGTQTSDIQAPRVNVLGGPDGQIIRIQLMADQAQREGRLDIAQKLLAQAKTMQDTLLAGQPEDYRLFKLEQIDKEFKARRTELAKLRKQEVNVGVGARVYQTELAKETIDIIRNAPKAVEALEKTNAVLALLQKGKANTGFAAQFRTDIGRSVALFSKRTPESVTDTETLQALLGSDVFPMIQSLGIGARGLDTPAERDFLLKVMTGSIELDSTTLQELTRIRAKVFERAIDEYNRRLEEGEFDDYMAETKRKLKRIQKPALAGSEKPPEGAGTEGKRKPLSDIFKK